VPFAEISLQIQSWLYTELHLSVEATDEVIVLLLIMTELVKTLAEVSLSWKVGTPHLDLTLYKQALPFLRLFRRRH
jgi:hypothetical protein